jgi:hypothetical protein
MPFSDSRRACGAHSFPLFFAPYPGRTLLWHGEHDASIAALRRNDEALVWAKPAQQWPNATIWAYFTEAVPLAHRPRSTPSTNRLIKTSRQCTGES